MVTASAVEIDLDIISVQENSYHHCELELKYHDTGNGWTFDLASVLKNSANVAIVDVGMLFSPPTLKLLNSGE